VSTVRTARRQSYVIEPHTYRGRSGYRIRGGPGRGVSIFVSRRITAEAIRDVLRNGGSADRVDQLIRADERARVSHGA